MKSGSFVVASIATCSAAMFVVLGVACGGGTADDTKGHWASGSASPVDTSFDGGLSLYDVYPTTDPDPDAAPRGGPVFGSDSGASSSATCTGKTGAKGDRTIALMSGGLARSSILHVPTTYDPTRPITLVLNLHGFGSNAAEQVIFTRMNGTADANNFIVAYPDGIGASWNAGDCCGDSWTNSVDDIAFIRALVADLESQYCVDTRRVFATGFSNGGFMSHRIACELSDIFAAVAPVSGTLGIPPASCHPTRAVPVLEFHGTADPIVPYNGGTPASPVNFGGPITFRSVDDTVSFWKTTDGCLDVGTVIYQKGDATCTEWSECRGRSDVVFCKLDGDGHTWPGGVPIPLGNTSTSISASDTIASFFAAHPMP